MTVVDEGLDEVNEIATANYEMTASPALAVDTAIEIRSLVKRYDAVEAVKGIDLSIARREIFGFLGPNGAGKSTTISVLCTLLKPTSGTATVAGFDVERHPAQVRQRIGLVFQDPSLDADLTARENLNFHAQAYGVPRSERGPRIDAALRMVELLDRGDSRVRTYSGGMKRRLEIARGVIHSPEVLFLDEPTIGLDPQTRARVWDHLREIHKNSSITIFMTTHYMEEAEWCDRIAVIDHGQIVAIGSPRELKASVGGDVVVFSTDQNDAAVQEIWQKFEIEAAIDKDEIRLEVANGPEFVPSLIHELSMPIKSVTVRQPSLDDVFLKLTGRAIREEEADPRSGWRGMGRAWSGRR